MDIVDERFFSDDEKESEKAHRTKKQTLNSVVDKKMYKVNL